MSNRVNDILNSLRENSSREEKEEVKEMTAYFRGKDEYERGMKRLNKSVNENLGDIVDEIIDVLDREDMLEEDIAETVLEYMADMVADIPYDKKIIRDMASNVEDYLDRR